MLRILLTISLIFSLSLSSGMSYLYAKCRPGHDDGGGGSTSSSSGGGGGMSNAAGAAAAFGLLFNVLQATRAQEDDAGVDLDALAMEYATAFNVIDPTATLIVLAGGGGSVSIAEPPPEDTPGCSCNAVGNNCACPEAFACGGATHVVQWDGESGGVLSAEWVCGGATLVDTGGVSIAEPPPEDKAVCSCGGGTCKCPREDACQVQYYGDRARSLEEGVEDVIPGSWLDGQIADAWDDYEIALEEAEKTCNKPSGVSGGGGGVSVANPPPEDTPVCGCGGGACKCPREDACQVQYYGDRARSLEEGVEDVIPGSWLDGQIADAWDDYKRILEEAEKTCK